MENISIDVILTFVSLLVGLFVGGGSVLVVLERAAKDKPLKDSTEKLLYESVPLSAFPFIQQLASAMQTGGKFIEEVTDGKPNEA